MCFSTQLYNSDYNGRAVTFNFHVKQTNPFFFFFFFLLAFLYKPTVFVYKVYFLLSSAHKTVFLLPLSCILATDRFAIEVFSKW